VPERLALDRAGRLLGTAVEHRLTALEIAERRTRTSYTLLLGLG
jgi:hypothetical protein